MLALTLFMGNTIMDAKTTNKTSKSSVKHSSSTITASTFVKKGTYGFGYKNNFEKSLINLGFKKISYMKTYEGPGDYDDGGTKRTYETKYTSTHNGKTTTVIIKDDYFNADIDITTRDVLIYFPGKSEVNQFINTIKALGFRVTSEDNEWGTTYEYKNTIGIAFSIKNNEIRIFDMEG